jgi:hypothetical protein
MIITLSPETVLLDAPFRFIRRESALPADLRPLRRVCQLVLIIDRCWASRATLEQLHVLDWACRTPQSRETFRESLATGRGPEVPCVRFDPSLNRAVDWGVGFGVLSTTSSRTTLQTNTLADYRVWLTAEGNRLLARLHEMYDCFTEEKQLLSCISGKITQGAIRPYLRWELT